MNIKGDIIHSQSKIGKREKRIVLTKEKNLTEQENVLNEIIENAIGLPPDNQEVLLMIAKAMKYTRECIIREYITEQN